MPSSAPAPIESAPSISASTSEKQPSKSPAEKKIFTAVGNKISAEIPPSENPSALEPHVRAVLICATEWPPGSEFASPLSMLTRVRINEAPPSTAIPIESRYDISGVDAAGNFVIEQTVQPTQNFDGTTEPAPSPSTLSPAKLVAETLTQFPHDQTSGKIDRNACMEQLKAVIPDKQARTYFVAFLEAQNAGQAEVGIVADQAVTTEAARSMGFFTPDLIIDLASKIPPPNGAPLLSENDINMLKGVKTPEPAAGTTPPPTPELSESAKKLQGIFNGEQILDATQVKDALFALGVPTDNGQLIKAQISAEAELAQKQSDLQGFTHNGTPDQLRQKQAWEARITELQNKLKTYNELHEQLMKNTGAGDFDVVTTYYKEIENGKGDEAFRKKFESAILNPTVTNMEQYDDSYEDKCNKHTTNEQKIARKKFFQNLITQGGLGIGALFAIQLWRASKKDKEQ